MPFIIDVLNSKYHVLRRGKQCIAVIPRHWGVTHAMCETLYSHWLLIHDYFNRDRSNIIFAPLRPNDVQKLVNVKILGESNGPL